MFSNVLYFNHVSHIDRTQEFALESRFVFFINGGME